jgi:hypothetical protein
MTNDTIRWSEAIAEGIDEDTLRLALDYEWHHHDDHNEVYWLRNELAKLLVLIEAEGRPHDDA